MKKDHLFISGPVNIEENVRKAVAEYKDIGHREPEFVELLKQIRKKLLKVFRANKKEYSALVFTGSGTSAMEAVMAANIHRGKKALIISNGSFGERFAEIAKVHKIPYKHLKYKWGEPIKTGKVESTLKKDKKIEAITLTHNETSVAIMNPVHEIGLLAKKYKKIFIVDSISTVGGEPVNVVKDHIDFATGTAAKALQAMPVLGIVCAKKAAIKKIRDILPRCFYLDLIKHYEYEEKHNQTPFTPAIPLFVALNKALDNLLKEGVKNRIQKYKQNAKMLRKGLQKLGMEFCLPEELRSNIVAYVMIPKGVKYKKLHKTLKKNGFVIYPGKGPLTGKAMHIANIGTVNKKTISQFLEVMEKAIHKKTQSKLRTCQ
ncbi:MAG: alanine--glyoxylate aminotransferase family protein [Candidatus Diapherotrites archaeon]|uniref:Alanine--glyoxylate aminotransferase family protein n=1 Tax=Candidatus Iainarchaeum sp. TaxID=3101447 RepID=A0A938YRV4_9ARCH|nr:alanine--glyoxylate aminotransferase family protein [Candidatus Diapherotrites archaeon]